MPGPLGQLKCLRASWADPLGRTYDLTSLAAAPAAAPAMANAAAADYTMPQDLTEQIIQQLWRVDVLAPRAAAVNQGCSLAAKRAAATLSVDDIAAPAAIVNVQHSQPLEPIGPSMADVVKHMCGDGLPLYPPRFYAFDINEPKYLLLDTDWRSLLDQRGSSGWLLGHVMDAYVKTTGLLAVDSPDIKSLMHVSSISPIEQVYLPTQYLLTDEVLLSPTFVGLHDLFKSADAKMVSTPYAHNFPT